LRFSLPQSSLLTFHKKNTEVHSKSMAFPFEANCHNPALCSKNILFVLYRIAADGLTIAHAATVGAGQPCIHPVQSNASKHPQGSGE
jgi:hypothetical protein